MRKLPTLLLTTILISGTAGYMAWNWFSKNRDSDNDGIPDDLEIAKYNTDPFKPNYLLYYALDKLPEEEAIKFKEVSYNESSKGLVDLLASFPPEEANSSDLDIDLIVFDKAVNESERISFAEKILNPRRNVEVSPYFLVGASYMTFWKIEGYGNWDLTQFHPILGQYRSNDPTIASHHIQQARDHGIGFFYLDFGWIRPGSRCDLAAQNGLLRAPNISLINFCIFYFPDAVTGKDWSTGNEALFYDFEYMATHYMSHPQYLRIDGREVVVIVNLPDYWRAYGVSGTNELFLGLKEAMREKHDLDLFIIGGVWPDSSSDFLETGPRVFDGVTVWGNLWDSLGNKAITSYDEYAERYVGIWKSWHKICEGEGISFVPLVKPGFNNTPYVRFGQELRVIKRDLQRFQLLLEEARNLSSRPLNMVLIFTWNDFNEGTSIEPSIEYGFSYMEAVRLAFSQEEEYVEAVAVPSNLMRKEYIFCIPDYEVKILVPEYLNLSNESTIDLYIRKLNPTLTGPFYVDIEFGVKARIPTPSLVTIYIFSDVDLIILGEPWFDIFRLEWPIWGVPFAAMDLERGRLGVYSSIVPIKEAEGDFAQLTTGEWIHVGTYNFYVIPEQYAAIWSEEVTIGPVTVKETLEDHWKGEYEELQEENRELRALNVTYQELLGNYTLLQGELSEAQTELDEARRDIGLAMTEIESARRQSTTLMAVIVVAFIIGLVIGMVSKGRMMKS